MPGECWWCEGWGCRRCTPQRGEQGPTAAELELERLRSRITDLERFVTCAADNAREFLATLDGKYFGQVERGDARPLRGIIQFANHLIERKATHG